MPIHDWSRIDHGVFHDFHQTWTIEIRKALNAGLRPPGFFALAERIISGPIPGVVTSAESDQYVDRANQIVIRRHLGQVIAVIEIVSPGNKSGRRALRKFTEKAPDKRLTVASYYAGAPKTAYVDPLAVGDPLPSSPIFLDAGFYVPAPLEAT
jgi:hypothetical protein